MAESAHKTKMTSWITVGLIVVACILLGIAMIAQSVPLAVVGGLLLVVGVVLGITGKIMEEVH